MSKREWTKAQKSAIDFEGQNLILSAAAGSGKTATLTERIISLLKSGKASLERMLVVTFTVAAAGELKARIGDALNAELAKNPGDRRLVRQLSALESAKISTIHSFFKSEIVPHATKFGLSPDFRVLDTVEATGIKEEAMEDTVFYFFSLSDKEKAEFEALCDCISQAKNEGSIVSQLLAIRDTLANKDISYDDIIKCADELSDSKDILKTNYYKAPVYHFDNGIKYFRMRFETMAEEIKQGKDTAKLLPICENCLEHIAALENALQTGYGEIHSLTADFKTMSMPGKGNYNDLDLKQRLSSLKGSFTEFVKGDIAPYFEAGIEKLEFTKRESAKILRTLAAVIEYFEKSFSAAKREKNAIDYSDMEHFAKELFVKKNGEASPLALEAGKKYDYIFIDEYQDTNVTQDSVFKAISKATSRFMVGDVKQSIYAFRGARPDLFMEYRNRYEQKNGGSAIFMSENFRSDRGVIDFANLVSSYIFNESSTPFGEGDRLVCAKKDAGGTPAKLCLIKKDIEDESDGENAEAAYTAQSIVELLNTHGYRPGDIAILLRGGTHAEDFEKSLILRGVPVNNAISENLFSYGEVLLVLCLLRATDNPLKDIYLAGAMKSPLCGFSLEELVKIRTNKNEPLWYNVRSYSQEGADYTLRKKTENFCHILNRWRREAIQCDADQILRIIIEDTGILRYKGDSRRTESDIARSIKILLSHGAKVAKDGGGLHELVSYLETLTEQRDSSGTPPSPDSVTIMTIHASKGLEFPVCFICDTAKQLCGAAKNSPIAVSDESIAIKVCDPKGLVQCSTQLIKALRLSEKLSSIDEEARILYVAMTRAREKLIITCKADDPKGAVESSMERAKLDTGAYEIRQASSMAQWILDATTRNISNECFEIVTVEETPNRKKYAQQSIKDEKNREFESFFKNTLDFTYSKDYLCNIPAKLVVSKLAPDVLDIGERSALDINTNTLFMPKEAPKPAFLSENAYSSADVGTATHIFMQFCSWQRLKNLGVTAELNWLAEHGFISAEQAKLVDLCHIEKFCQSELFSKLLNAKSVLRERRFNAVVDAWRFTENEELCQKLKEENIQLTVQGVVDCMFLDKDGKYVLLDYKTDALTKEECNDKKLAAKKLLPRHRRQLLTYRDVCQKLLGITFDRVFIYSLPLGDCIAVE